LGDDDSFLEHHVLDSTGFLELISHLEETYGIKVLDDEMVPENLDSLRSVADFIARKRAA
jgi:acyl carrier protein